MRRADTHLQEMARDVPLAALGRSAVPRYAGGIEPALEMRLQNFPELTALRVFDAGGDMLYASDSRTAARVNIADRAHFRQTRDAPPDSLVFSEVLTARTTGHQSLFVERALRDRQGAFRGVVTATIELEYFQKLFQSLDMGPHGVISIYRRDDFTQVVRRPPGGVGTNTPLPPGNPTYGVAASGNKISTLEFPASTDGVVRIYSYDLLDRYPFFVTVGLAHEDVLAAWRTRSLAVGAAVLLLLLLLTGTMIRLWRSEDRLVEASAAAEAASRFKSAFLANMSHELRTPLNAIIGFSQIIGSQMHGPAAGERYAGYARDILQAGNHLLELINSVLDLSKIEAGKFELRDERVEIADLVGAGVALVRLQAEAKGVPIGAAVPPDLPPVRADETALRQILVNLLSNAVKFTKAGGRVDVSAGRDADGALVLAVADTGIGMTAEEIAKATLPFVQIDDPLNKRHGGTGLGLPISKRLAELLGGSLEIASTKNAGTTVRVRLPPARVLPAAAPATAVPLQAQSSSRPSEARAGIHLSAVAGGRK